MVHPHVWAKDYDFKEASFRLRGYPNAYAITQMLEGGEPYDAQTESARACRESIKNALIARCPDFAAAFAAHV